MCNAWNHPPGCTCGWGGEGHAGAGFGGGSWSGGSYAVPPGRSYSGTREWHERDFTHPTRCPECGADVFFIRHNGGSVWVDPPLGWPWPKHACFDKPDEPTRTFSQWTAQSSGLTNPKLGIITSIIGDPRSAEPVLEVRFTDSSQASLILRWTPPDSSILGALVIVSQEDSLLLHQDHAEIPFHSFTRLESPAKRAPNSAPMVYCFRCKTVHRKGGYEHQRCSSMLGAKIHHKHRGKPTRPDLPPWRKHLEKKPPPAPRPAPITPKLAPALRLPTSDERVKQAIESVAKEAWAAAAGLETEEKRWKRAKQAALVLIRRLSPSIKGRVEHHYAFNKWLPLHSRKPK